MSFSEKNVIAVGLLVLCTLAVYANTLQNPFLWDDHFFILQNKLIQDPRHLPDLFTTEFFSKGRQESDFSDGGYYRPLISLSFMLDYRIWGEFSLGYHLTNLLFHLFNVLLVYRLGKILLGKPAPAFWGALLFGIHPIQTEAVSYIPSRVDLIGVFFYLGAWLLFDRAVRSRRGVRLAFSLGLFSLSLLSKEMTVTLPILLFSYAFVFTGPDRRRALFYTLPFWTLLFVYLLSRALYFPVTGKPLWEYLPNLPWALLSSGSLVLSYCRLLLIPHPLHLERSHPLMESLRDPRALLFLVLAGLLAASFVALRERRKERFLLSAFLLTLLPVVNIVPIYPSMAEHYLYLPSIAIFLLGAGLLEKRYSGIPVLILCLIMAGYGVRTVLRNLEYSNEISFFEQTRRYAPQSAVVHNNLGSLYAAEGRSKEAIPEFLEALRLEPGHAETLANLGMAYRGLEEYDKAVLYYDKAIQLKPYSRFYNSLGVCYAFQGKNEDAEKAFRRAIVLAPDFSDAYYNLGKLYWDQKRWSDVEAVWRKGLEGDPAHPLMKEWLGKLPERKEMDKNSQERTKLF